MKKIISILTLLIFTLSYSEEKSAVKLIKKNLKIK